MFRNGPLWSHPPASVAAPPFLPHPLASRLSGEGSASLGLPRVPHLSYRLCVVGELPQSWGCMHLLPGVFPGECQPPKRKDLKGLILVVPQGSDPVDQRPDQSESSIRLHEASCKRAGPCLQTESMSLVRHLGKVHKMRS